MSGSYNPAAGMYGTVNPQTAPATGSFIPQTPYSPGYTSPGYQPPATAYSQTGNSAYNPNRAYNPNNPYIPNNPYAQMGRNTQGSQPQQDSQISQMPLNGGGYVPRQVPVRRGPFELKDFVLVIAGSVLLILFIVGLILGLQANSAAHTAGVVIQVLFIILAGLTAGALWIRPMTAQNKRMCYTIVAAALVTVTILSFFLRSGNRTTNTGMPSATPASTSASNTQQQTVTATDPNANTGTSAVIAESVTTEAPAATNEAADRLVAFLKYWGGNRIDEMLTLCAPSWLSKQQNPKNELFSLMQNRTPKEFMLENITGTDADSSRQITMKISIDRNNGKQAVVYRMTVLMLKESGEWYVDPKSLQSNEVDVTPDPNVTPTPAPTPAPYVDSNTVLYYNPDGGELYHLDQNCRIINARYLPLKGHFTYGQINDSPYSELKPCNVCGAPLR